MVRCPGSEAHLNGRLKKWLESAEGWAKANLLFEFNKNAGRLPPEGSIREAIFLGVWLRHQEIEANKIRVMAQGFADSVGGSSVKGTAEAFRAVMEGMFPFVGKVKESSDKELLKKMSEEVDKGPLFFSPVVMKSLRNAVSKVTVSDDFKQKLQGRIKKRQ